MPVDIKEIKKLPRKEKLKLIGQLWDSINDGPPCSYTKEEEEKLLFERLEDIKTGRAKTDTWENVKKRLMEKSFQRQKEAAPNVRS
jgi:putative addiction module component (TIGR02574 family)